MGGVAPLTAMFLVLFKGQLYRSLGFAYSLKYCTYVLGMPSGCAQHPELVGVTFLVFYFSSYKIHTTHEKHIHVSQKSTLPQFPKTACSRIFPMNVLTQILCHSFILLLFCTLLHLIHHLCATIQRYRKH